VKLAVNGADATPEALVATVIVVELENLPLAPELGAVKVTLTPESGLLPASFTVTAGALKAVNMVALCGVVPGFVVMDGGAVTVNVAAVVVAVPTALVNTARYRVPFSPAATGKVSVVAVAPAMLLKMAPPSVLCCHCTVGDGMPVAVAEKLTGDPVLTVAFVGFDVTTGAAVTVKVAAVVVAEPLLLVNTAR
jgi:hypothetical protein